MMALRALLRSRAAVRLFATEAIVIPPELLAELPPGMKLPENPEVLTIWNANQVDPTPEPAAHFDFPTPFPQRTYGNFSDQITTVAHELRRNLATVLPGKASAHMFTGLKVFAQGDFVPFNIAARTIKVAEDEVSVISYDYYQSPMVELALKKSGMKLEILRNFHTIKVKILDYNREAALKQVEDFAEQAKQKVRNIFVQQKNHAKTHGLDLAPQGEQLQLSLFDLIVAEKKSTL